MDRDVALLCNPSAGGGRAARLLPRAEDEVDGRSFIGIASLGFDSEANRIANAAPARLGRLVYVYGALRALAAWKPGHYELLLDVVLIGAQPKRSFLATLPKAFKGTHILHPAVRVLRGRELHVDAERPFVVYADGDPIGTTPATIRVVPRALRVLVPA